MWEPAGAPGSFLRQATPGSAVMMEAVLSGEVVARSDDTVVVEGNHYFPLKSMTKGVLHRTRMKSLRP